MPLPEAGSEIRISPTGEHSRVTWTFDYRVKYGPLGWPMDEDGDEQDHRRQPEGIGRHGAGKLVFIADGMAR